jgi:hypothetical protein
MKYIIIAALVFLNCGEPGPQGVQGEKGEKGERGATGSAGLSVLHDVECYKLFESTSSNPNWFSARHSVLIYSDGSTFASCEINTSSDSWFSNKFYRASSRGADVGYCSVWMGSGYVSFQLTNGQSELKINGGTPSAKFDCNVY